MKMNHFSDAEKQTQYKPNQTRSEAEIPTGELLGILKPGTYFKRDLAKMGHHEAVKCVDTALQFTLNLIKTSKAKK